MRTTTLIVIALLSLVFVPLAMGHAEITPTKAPADSVVRLVLRVEGEESVPAVRVAVQLPRGLFEVSFEPVPGWKRTVSGRVVTWSGGTIGHGEFGRFALRARVPASGGQLVFPTVQTYANGVVARWIGAPSSDMPAPRITLTAARTQPPPPVVTTVSPPEEDDTGPAIWLLAGGLVVGLGALGFALVRRRRS